MNEPLGPPTTRGSWRGHPVLVTGCSGFLGAWVSHALLARGARVVGLAREWPGAGSAFERLALSHAIEVVDGDVTDGALLARVLAEHAVETVIHTAACSQPAAALRSPAAALDTNVRGTWTVLEAARHAPLAPAVVLVSTDAVYGDAGEEWCDEDHPLQGDSPYAVSKICAELLTRSYSRCYGVRAAAARFTNLYGGGDANAARLVPSIAASVARGEAPVVRSDGAAQRDFLHVDDAADGCLRLAAHLHAHGTRPGTDDVFNFSSERLVSVLDLVRLALHVAGRDDLAPDVRREYRDDVAVKRVCSARARERLDWVAQTSLARGLALTLDWYRSGAGQAGPRLDGQT